MDPTQVSSFGAFAEKFGFNALLVLALLYGLWKMNASCREERKDLETAATAERQKRDERDESREQARRAEREADRKAHVEALGLHTTKLGEIGQTVDRLRDKISALPLRLGRANGALSDDTDPGINK